MGWGEGDSVFLTLDMYVVILEHSLNIQSEFLTSDIFLLAVHVQIYFLLRLILVAVRDLNGIMDSPLIIVAIY